MNLFKIILKLKDHSSNVEKLRKALEQQIVDLQVRIEQAEASALKGGKRVVQKLEQRVIYLISFKKLNEIIILKTIQRLLN